MRFHSIAPSASGQFAKDYLVQWLKDNPEVDVVRFTTFSTILLLYSTTMPKKFVDWFGYGATVSVKALEEFELSTATAAAEDIMDNGYYSSTFGYRQSIIWIYGFYPALCC